MTEQNKNRLMKTINFNKIVLLLLSLVVFNGCVEDDDFDTPNTAIVDPNISADDIISISAVAGELAQAQQDSQGIFTFEFDDGVEKYVEGYVISNDEAGNFFEEITIQDAPENPTIGLRVMIDVNPLFVRYEVGRKIYVKLNELTVGISNGVLTLGKLEGIDGVEKIAASLESETLLRTTEVATIVPRVTTISELDDSMLNTFIQLENIQVSGTALGKTYASEPEDQFDGERILESCVDGGTIVLSTSTFSDFKGLTLPSGSGTISGVFVKNFFGDTNNLAINTPEDVNMGNARCDISEPLEPNLTISELRDMFTGSNLVFLPGSNTVVEGYVVSSDAEGNFFRNIYIQDAPENPTAALQILVNENDLHFVYPVGSRVLLKLDGLHAGEGFGGVFSVGYLDGNEIDRIDEGQIGTVLFTTGEQETIVPTPAIIGAAGLTIDELDENGNTVDNDMDGNPDQIPAPEGILIQLSEMQLPQGDIGVPYASFNGNQAANRVVESCESSNNIIMRNSGFASFASEFFPTGRGTIRAVISQFNGTPQLLIRNTFDVDLEGPRCDPFFLEDFQDAVDNTTLDTEGWTNYNEAGSRLWTEDVFNGNGAARFTPFSSGDTSNIGWLISPGIDMDAQEGEVLTFQMQHAFPDAGHDPMELLISTDFDGTEAGIATATWTSIPFTKSYIVDPGTWFNFVGSGDIDLSGVTGTAYIAFKYTGSDTANENMTIDIDDVKIFIP